MSRNCAKTLATLMGKRHSRDRYSVITRNASSTYGDSSSNLTDTTDCQCSKTLFSSCNNHKIGNDAIATKSLEEALTYWKPSEYVRRSQFIADKTVMMQKHALMSLPTFHHLQKCSIPTASTCVRLYCSKSGNNNEDDISVTDIASPSSHFSSFSPQDNYKNHKHLPNNSSIDGAQVQRASFPKNSQLFDCSTTQYDIIKTLESQSSVSGIVSSSSAGRLVKSCGNNGFSFGAANSGVSATSSPSVFGSVATGNASSNFTPMRSVVTSQRLVEVTRDSIMEQPKLMSKEEREEFMSVYHQLVKELLEIPDMKDMEETNRWMARVLQYNVPHGKRNRGLSTALAYKYLAPEELTEENVRLSYVLGWCVEILQAFFLVADDIMDESETRRGRPCWYKVDNLGLAAVNDAILLEATIYAILRKHFSDKPYYAKVMEVMHDVTYKTIFGQSLDTRTGQDRRMETYTMDRYSSIVKYKTSYYSFYLPAALAMTMCEITDPALFQQMRKVTLEMGHFFQVQDDYLDCFGDVEVTGKIGTDIQDCKCSWLFVVAVQMCTPEQKKFLFDNYGKHNPENIEAVKKLYKELDMENVYRNYEEQTYNMICTHIQQMNDELPKGLFYDMLHKIYKRNS